MLASTDIKASRIVLAEFWVPTHTQPSATGIIQIHRLLTATPIRMVLLSTAEVKKSTIVMTSVTVTHATCARREYVL